MSFVPSVPAIWLAGYLLSLVLAATGVCVYVLRRGRVSRRVWIAWSLASLLAGSLFLLDGCQRLEAAFEEAPQVVFKFALLSASSVVIALVMRSAAVASHLAPGRPLRLPLALLALNGLAAFSAADRFYATAEPVPALLTEQVPYWTWERVDEKVAWTDRGRTIRLYVGNAGDVAELDKLTRPFPERAISLQQDNHRANCHGWVFTGGAYTLDGNDVGTVLQDNGYHLTSEPRSGDLIVYRQGHDIVHTGIVRFAYDGSVIVESKWSLGGVYLHPPEDQGYSRSFAYYRSPRRGHLLAIVDSDQDGDAAPGLLSRVTLPLFRLVGEDAAGDAGLVQLQHLQGLLHGLARRVIQSNDQDGGVSRLGQW
jgi:hypothetical protein